MIVVANASPLIILSNIDELEVLHFLFKEILIPEAVVKEYRKVLLDWKKGCKPNTNWLERDRKLAQISEKAK